MDRTLLLLGAAFFVLLYPLLADNRYWKPTPILVDVAALPGLPAPPAPEAPAQVPIEERVVDLGHGKTATLSHRYVIEGAVLARGRYRFSGHADISPLDLSIVTGAMAAPEYVRHMGARNGGRVTRFWWRDTAPPELANGFGDWITNNHVIPSTDALRDRLLAVETGQSVRIEGYLVTVVATDHLDWRSSTERDDVGCEIILVTELSVMEPTAENGA